jgi:hypothetical protein
MRPNRPTPRKEVPDEEIIQAHGRPRPATTATGADDGEDGFAVFQLCTYVSNHINASAYTSPTNADPRLNQGRLDQNIYSARL